MEKKFSNMKNVCDMRGIVIIANIYYYKSPASVRYFSKGLRSLYHLLLKRPKSSHMSIIPSEIPKKQSLRTDLPCAPQITKWCAKSWLSAHLMQSLCSWEHFCPEDSQNTKLSATLKKKKSICTFRKNPGWIYTETLTVIASEWWGYRSLSFSSSNQSFILNHPDSEH